ncbi:haspin [Aphomia sociella]
MRRTYKSKKEASGALDHRDMLCAMDEKSSAFDAFYIQNIKQTMREMSSVSTSNHYGVAAKKVRKRKYVKRIVKDLEPTHEESTASAFLTPDKSLHVNKAPDPFDQLLNTPSRQNDSLGKDNLFDKLRNKGKTYIRKKNTKIKKYNYSSSDTSESEKENTSCKDLKTQDLSDIGMHKLLIEKDKKPSPKYLDESINNIVNNFSILKSPNYRKTHSNMMPKYLTYKKNRLTRNIQSPLLRNSPLCSTPFKEKYRGASIYKFSPISTKNNDSPNYITLHEESKVNNSIILSEHKNFSNLITKSQENNIDMSPILMKTTNSSRKISPVVNSPLSPIICVPNSKTIVTEQNNVSVIQLLPKEDLSPNCSFKNKTESVVNSSHEKVNNSIISSIELSSFQNTEVEPFLGFSNNKHLDKSDRNYNNSVVENLDNSVMPIEAANTVDALSETDEDSKSDVSDVSKTSHSTTHINNTSLSSQDNESMYDTCDSGESQEDIIREPVVIVERINDSIFKKYYENMPNYDDKEISRCSFESSDNSQSSCQDYASFEDNNSFASDSQNNEDSNLSNIDSEGLSDENGTDFNSNSEEERCISFVTTRRRNEVTNDSMIMTLNDSYCSASSTDCDKTVLSNNVTFQENMRQETNLLNLSQNSKDKTTGLDKNDVIKNVTVQPDEPTKLTVITRKSTKIRDSILITSEDSTINESKPSVLLHSEQPTMSMVTTRKSAKIRDSMLNISEDSRVNKEIKPSIVLQPGKKWERSLSIYRRMTMAGSDHSLIEDEPVHTKGRKYRQSVISTMEMQEAGSLHNESINSRRSTFVSKPNRCTIKIVKEANSSRSSVRSTTEFDDLNGFLTEVCDDTIVELSKLSITDSDPEVTVLDHFHETTGRVATARDYVLRRCNQTETILFDECYPDRVLKNCRKIGEGVYGEVFLWRAGDGRARVMKIVPIAGTTKVNGEHQKDFHEIISEIVIAMELSALRAPIADIERHFDEGKDIEGLDLHSVVNASDIFNEVLDVKCVYGGYPSRLLDLWELFDECKGSENDNPAILPVDQQYIVLELANAGQDLESYQFNSAEQAHALFLQVAFGLAVGEESFQFEHRDLHWGNVLIAPTDQKFATFVLRGRARRVPRCGVAATIIDYSLSRLSLPLAADSAALYNDLAADDSLFEAVGDYQFEVYRLMREKLGNDWKNFEPYTNILWLHYTVDKMITALRYKRTNTKIHKHYISKLKGIKNRILDYGSATQFVLTDNEF